MFALFFSLYYSMLAGRWLNITNSNIVSILQPVGNSLSEFLTSIFGDFQMKTLGDALFSTYSISGQNYVNWMSLVAFILALITSIGIVVMAVKGIKRVFSIFFMPIR